MLRSAAGVPQAAIETQGAKAALFKILGAAEEPLTSGARRLLCTALQCCHADGHLQMLALRCRWWWW
jgi:hypothetical protein